MELPPYRVPTIKGLAIHTWERTWQYVKKAGTVILGISIVLWAAMTFPGLPMEQQQDFETRRQAVLNDARHSGDHSVQTTALLSVKDRLSAIDAAEAEAGLRHSFAGRVGIALEGISRYAGFDWRTNIALVGGFAAKEVIVATLGTAYSLGEADSQDSASLSQMLSHSSHWRPLVAISVMVFVMFYAPCFVSVVCIAREAGSWRWGAFSILFNTVLALFLAICVFQAGRLLGF